VSADSGALDAVEQVVSRGGEADTVLREVVTVLHEHLDRFVRISFVEGEEMVRGPAAGEEVAATAFPIVFQGNRVADLEAGGELSLGEQAVLERVAVLVSPYALVGWDTGGEEWTP
jgi:hypothetical protein